MERKKGSPNTVKEKRKHKSREVSHEGNIIILQPKDCTKANSCPSMEKAADVTVAQRAKKRGMSLYKRNANPLIKLRLLKLNEEWDAYWHKRY